MQQGIQSSGCQRSHRKLGMARAGSDMFEQIIALGRYYASVMGTTARGWATKNKQGTWGNIGGKA